MGISATERHLFLVCPDDLQRYFSVCYDLRGASKREYNVKATHRPMRRIFHDVPFRILSNGYFIVTELLCANSPMAVRVAQLPCREAGFEASAAPASPLSAPARRRSPLRRRGVLGRGARHYHRRGRRTLRPHRHLHPCADRGGSGTLHEVMKKTAPVPFTERDRGCFGVAILFRQDRGHKWHNLI